jgi:low affinity Fe/Cu permease
LFGTTLARPTSMTSRSRHGHALAGGEKLPQRGVGHWFTRTASSVANLVGSPWAFLAAIGVIVTWAITGPIFGFSSDWQLVVNTGTTIVTFLMVFLIQNTQNRDSRAIHLKLDELIRAMPQARNEFMEVEDEDLDEIEREKRIVDKADPAPPADRRAPAGDGKTKHH